MSESSYVQGKYCSFVSAEISCVRPSLWHLQCRPEYEIEPGAGDNAQGYVRPKENLHGAEKPWSSSRDSILANVQHDNPYSGRRSVPALD